jgi:hypothetical protein
MEIEATSMEGFTRTLKPRDELEVMVALAVIEQLISGENGRLAYFALVTQGEFCAIH